MTAPRLTADAVRGLAEAATPGPWKVCETSIDGKKYGGCWVEGPDEPDDEGRLHGTLIPMSGSHGSKSYTTRLVDRQDHDHNDANARLIAAAPDLAADWLRQEARIKAMEEALTWQDIESAPRDRMIMVWDGEHTISAWIGGEWHSCLPENPPTHWMDLPAPPSTALNPTEGVDE